MRPDAGTAPVVKVDLLLQEACGTTTIILPREHPCLGEAASQVARMDVEIAPTLFTGSTRIFMRQGPSATVKLNEGKMEIRFPRHDDVYTASLPDLLFQKSSVHSSEVDVSLTGMVMQCL